MATIYDHDAPSLQQSNPCFFNGDLSSLCYAYRVEWFTHKLESLVLGLVYNGYDMEDHLVPQQGIVMDESWTTKLLLRNTIVEFNSYQYVLDNAHHILYDTCGHGNILQIQWDLAIQQQE